VPRAATTSRRSRPNPDDFARRDIEFHRITAASYDDERLYLAVSRAPALLWRRRRGNLVFVFGVNP